MPALLLLALLVVQAEAAPAAPGFRVRLLDGKTSLDSRNLIGKKVLVLRFQASWCKPCAKESAALAQVAERYRGRGVETLAIHVQDTAADAQGFVREQNATYPVALDPRLTVGNRFGFKGTPYTVVISRKGETMTRIQGPADEARLARAIDPLLAPAKNPP